MRQIQTKGKGKTYKYKETKVGKDSKRGDGLDMVTIMSFIAALLIYCFCSLFD